MSGEVLSIRAKEALRAIRSWVMRYGQVPSTRELMNEMEYKSPRSAMLLMEELEEGGFLKKKTDGGYTLIKDIENDGITRTIPVPLVGTVTCGIPMLAEQNIEAMIPVSRALLHPGSKYFLLKAKGDSMDMAGIHDGDLLLVKQQPVAENGQHVVALIDDEATVKEFRRTDSVITLLPKSNNNSHQPIIVTRDIQIQGIVTTVIPKINNQ